MGARIEKIKKHLRENKTAYLAGGGGVILGAIGVLYFKKDSIIAVQYQGPSYKPVQTIDIHVEALGDPGNIIQDVNTGIVYASQNQAANALDISPSRVSSALNGKGDIPGHNLVKLGKAHVGAQ